MNFLALLCCKFLYRFFSDLEGVFPKDVPQYEVRWVSPKGKNIPFRGTILLED
ncbi:MAG: hypothetical protein FAF05_04175 [Epsilonproteobacteria bacterium]|nr:hypothetical protein [Campylobacterota bacterium]